MEIYAKSLLVGVSEEVILSNLEIMVLNHITTYKFSNIDYFNKEFDYSYYPKYVIQRLIETKYGICMDLNYAFSIFLTSRNFKNYLVRCIKPNSRSEQKGIFHLSIIVIINNNKYFVDVGYGEFFIKPILLSNGLINNIHVHCDNDKYYLHINKLTLKIIDNPVNLVEMKENYIKFLKSEPEDMAINKLLFERIYDKSLEQYVNPKLKCAL